MTVDTFVLNTTSWLLTYAVHSSLLLVVVWGIVRTFKPSYSAQELLWKVAMFGGIVTGGMHVATGGGFGPSWSLGPQIETVASQEIVTLEASPISEVAPMSVPSNPPSIRNANTPAAPMNRAAGSTPPTTEFSSASTDRFEWLSWPLALSMLWLTGLVLAAVRFIRARVNLARLLGDRRAVQDPFLLEELDQLRQAAGLTHPVKLSWSPRLVAPVALRSEVCLPRRALTDLDPALRTGMLAHELAHVARQDSTWLHLTFGLRLAMFFQPLNLIAYRRLQELAEYLCDEWAVRHTGHRRAVAECLAEVAQWIDRADRPIPLPSMAYDGSNLVHRVERILSQREDQNMVPRSLKLVTVVGAVALFGAAAPGFAPSRPVDLPSPAVAPEVIEASLPAIDLRPTETPEAIEAPAATSISSPASTVEAVVNDNAPTAVLGRLLNDLAQQAVRDTVDPRVVASLIRVLDDEDPDVRREAAEALGRLKASTAVPNLIATLDDNATPVRAYAAWALGQIKDPRGLNPSLDAMVQDDSARVRRAAASAARSILSSRDRSTFDASQVGARFAQLLRDDDSELRQAGIAALRELRLSQYGAAIAPLMTDTSAAVRRGAASALGRFQTPEGLAPLTRALGDASASVRRSALNAIARYNNPSSGAAIRRALTDDSEDVRRSAAQLLGERKDSTAFDALMSTTTDPNSDVRVASLRALRQLRMPGALSAYTRALGDENRSVRSSGVAGLGEMRDPSALPALGRAAQDSSGSVREVAIRAIHRIGDTTATSTLIRALRDPEPDVRERAANALGDIRTSRAVDPLGAVLRDSVADVRRQAIRSLAKYNAASTYSVFVGALSDSNDDVRESAVQALGSLKDPRAIDPLAIRIESDPNSEVRKRALRSLGAIGGSAIVMPTIGALDDGSSEVRAMAVNILGQLRDARAIEPLMRALEDDSNEVRRAATRALGRIQGR